MIVSISLNAADVQARVAQLKKEIPTKLDNALLRTATQGNAIIKRRTNQGQGIEKRFAPYTPKYAAFRRKEGRQVSPVNLQFKGNMLSAMQAFKGRGEAKIAFTRSVEAKKAYFNNRKRPFFGVNNTEKRKLMAFFKKELFK
jgi:hypothetical protein